MVAKAEYVKPTWVTSKRKLAVAVGVARETVEDWSIRPGFPKKTARGYNVAKVEEWRDANVKPAPSKAPAPRGHRARLIKAQADEREAKAALAALKLAIERGQYQPLDEIQKRTRAQIAIVKRGLLGLGRRIAPAVVGRDVRDIERIVTQACKELLTRFANSE